MDTPSDSPARRWLKRLAWLEPFWIGALGLALMMPPRFLPSGLASLAADWRPWLTVALAAGWPIRWLAYRTWSRRTPIDWPLLLLMVWLVVSFWASSDKTLSWVAISYLLFGVALYLALLNWPPTQRQPQYIGWGVLLIGLGLALLMPLLSDFVTGKLFTLPGAAEVTRQIALRLPGEVNPNLIAGILVTALPLPVALTIGPNWSRRRWLRLVCGATALFILAMLVLTQSRGSYLAAILVLTLIGLLRWPRLTLALPLLIVIGGVAAYVIEMNRPGTLLSAFEGRPEIWNRALYAIEDFPLTGIGIGTWNRVMPVWYPIFTSGLGHDNAHNLLLQITVDVGLPGLMAYLAILIGTFATLARTLRRRATPVDWAWAAGITGALVAMLIHGLFEVAVWNARPMFVTWLLIAAAMLLGTRTDNAPASST